MEQERASKKQQELLSFVDSFIKESGYGPSYREIMNGLGYKSVSTVAIHIDNLIAKGYLARRDKSARSLEVVSLSPTQAVASPLTDVTAELSRRIALLDTNDETRVKVSEALLLLGFDELATSITKEKNEKTS